MKKLAIITTHPIQYNAPLFALLSRRNDFQIKVFYTWGKSVLSSKYDPGFGKIIDWDINLLDGYEYEFIENVASNKGSHRFDGIDNPELITKITSFDPQAILVYGWSLKSHFKAMRYFKGRIPVLFRGDSHLLDHQPWVKKTIKRIYLNWVYKYVDTAFYVGESNYNYYIASGLHAEQLCYAPHAIDNKRFSEITNEIQNQTRELKNKFKISEHDIVFLFAGKFESKKDPMILLRSFLELKFDSNIHLLLVGNGELENDLKSTASNHHNIHFLDFCNQSEMPAIYHLATVFVLPSKGPGESWGLSVNEAMAAGKPVIVSDKCGCAASLVNNKKNGLVFTAGDASSLQKALEYMVNNKNELKSMGDFSSQIISSYSFEHIAAAIASTLN